MLWTSDSGVWTRPPGRSAAAATAARWPARRRRARPPGRARPRRRTRRRPPPAGRPPRARRRRRTRAGRLPERGRSLSRPPRASTASAASSCPRSRRAPAATMYSSARASGSSRRTSGSLSSRSACCGPAQRPLAVGDDRQIARVAQDAPRRAEFAEGLGPLLTPVGGNTDGLPHRADAGRAGARRPGQLQRLGRVGVEQSPGCHQVPADRLGVRLGQRLELGPDLAIEQARVGVLGHRRSALRTTAFPVARAARDRPGLSVRATERRARRSARIRPVAGAGRRGRARRPGSRLAWDRPAPRDHRHPARAGGDPAGLRCRGAAPPSAESCSCRTPAAQARVESSEG